MPFMWFMKSLPDARRGGQQCAALSYVWKKQQQKKNVPTSHAELMMAVDLTPRFRRLNSQTRSLRDNVQHVFSGPFGATHLWHNIIQALQTQVEVRRCRRHLRVHADCFTGSDAVDAVLSYLMQNVVFCTSEVSRLKAARLCQALMEAKVFEPVGTKLFRRDKEAAFEDSSCSLYRFLEYKALPGSSVKECSSVTENMLPEELETKRKKSSRYELRTISNPLAVGPLDKRVERLLRTINLRLSMSPASNTALTSSAFLSKAVVDEVWKQQTLLLLLQIVELPMLDCILTSPARAQPQACRGPLTSQDLVISNTCLERELPDALNLPQLDGWLSAAADCLELLPDQLIVFAGEQLSQGSDSFAEEESAERMASRKRLLFDTISKYYSGQEKAPLLSGRYLDIHVAILNLLDGGKLQDAIKASQLCLRLLETSVRDELRRLLAFMATAAHPDATRLQKQIDNRALVCRTFQRAIVQNHELTRSQSETLVLFLVDIHTELFKTPTSLIEAVRRTLRTMQQGKDPNSIATFTFCHQVTPQEYDDQREATTLESLKQLLCDISSSKSMSAKHRRRLLKEFEKHHPVVFLQHFSSTF
ncbi:DEP domain-containing protein 4 isoform X1 [Scophthalmus maximus]|uniref:DEP domain-containing protein 4 isoform X1 n=1 Tax=Scophthalmus maximus TaxID=52904 RepID=UPI001FA89A97|nr:DEP domain-containing protein 4 isoform X1 [Scophthalmus maximus]